MARVIARFPLGYCTWTVLLSNKGDFAGKEPRLFGRTSYTKRTITISSVLSAEARRETLIHEVGHVVCWTFGLYLRCKEFVHDESTANLAALVLMQVLDNRSSFLKG